MSGRIYVLFAPGEQALPTELEVVLARMRA
jgi:hypothetical protein